MELRSVFIAAAARTALGRFDGALAGIPATELGGIIIKECIARSGVDPNGVDEVIMGHVIQAGCGSNTARQAALIAELPVTMPSFTVNKVCVSGMKATALAALSIAAEESDVVIAGGMENMSRAPYLLANARSGYRLGDGVMVDSLLRDALTDPLGGYHMAQTAERLAEDYSISREDQDRFALLSNQRAVAAAENGSFKEEIVSVPIPRRKGEPWQFSKDEGPRANTSLEKLGKLKPAFAKEGTITAGNASTINDGSAALLLASEDGLKAHGLTPLARIIASTSAGFEPERMGMAPVYAARALLDRTGMALDDFQVVELNEAFAAQSLAVIGKLGLDPDLVNRNGGAIALGHPVGVSGARIIVTLLGIMRSQGRSPGLATVCAGGGQGMAMALELV